MAEFPYTPNPANVRRFLEFIQTAGVPPKISQTYLEGSGFRSSNDRYLIPVMKALGFVDGSSQPTDVWRGFRDKSQSGRILADAVRKTYAGLFETYPDAPARGNEALRNFFSAHSAAGEAALGRMVATFRNLCSLADFENTTSPVAIGQVGDHGLVNARPAQVQPSPDLPGAETYRVEGVFIQIIPSRKNIDRARKILEVVELSLTE